MGVSYERGTPVTPKPGSADAAKFKENFEKVQKGGAKDMTVIKQVASLRAPF